MALEAAQQAVDGGADLVAIRCVDHLRTGYERAERDALMRIYGDVSVPEAYTSLAKRFCRVQGIAREDFERVSRALEANYRATAKARGLALPSAGAHDVMITEWFRRADCANPNIDFECDLFCSSEAEAEGLQSARVYDVGTTMASDGPEFVDSLASYAHLGSLLRRVCTNSGVSIAELWRSASLEVYTCFPIVPLAFLFVSGLANDVDDAIALIESRPLTESGGMTIGRAPWNGPALRGLALVAKRVAGGASLGLVHGNGGLGGYQGFALLGATSLAHQKSLKRL
jgi:hypothetical protein